MKVRGFSDTGVGQNNKLIEFVRRQLSKVRGPQRENRRYVNIVCPFHDDKNPSLGVRISHPTTHSAIGSIHCFGCKTSGDWNKLAEKLGLEQLPKDIANAEDEFVDDTGEILDELLGTPAATVQDLLRGLDPPLRAFKPWPVFNEWRGFSGDFLKTFNAQEVLRSGRKAGTTFTQLLLPVSVEGHLVGGVLCSLEKRKNTPSYRNTAGSWSRDSGLFPYDQCLPIIRRKGYVILVEGPRDALKLLRDGIPAMCILGVSSFTAKKALLVAATGADLVVLLGDGDEAGRTFNEHAYSELADLIPVQIIKLPLTGVDPFSLGKKATARMLQMIEQRLAVVRA